MRPPNATESVWDTAYPAEWRGVGGWRRPLQPSPSTYWFVYLNGDKAGRPFGVDLETTTYWRLWASGEVQGEYLASTTPYTVASSASYAPIPWPPEVPGSPSTGWSFVEEEEGEGG